MLKHYITYWYPGAFCSESSCKEVDKRYEMPVLPKYVYAWQYFSKEVTIQNGEELKGEPKNYGPQCIIGEVFTLEKVREVMPHEGTLISNMEGNNWKRVVHCRQGFIPLNDGDMVFEEHEVQRS